MNRVPAPKTRRNVLLATPKGKQSKSEVRPTIIRRKLLVLLAILCGVVLATDTIVLLPKYLNTPVISKNVTTSSRAEVTSVVPSASQDNPLFATLPSWSENYAGQNSGVPDPLYFNTIVGPAANSNKEQQYYTADNSNLRIANGALQLIGTHQTEPNGYQYGSSRLETQGKKTFLYGRLDVTAKLPSGAGTWPAIWLLPANDVYASKSPDTDFTRYKNGGELDIMEAVGYEPNQNYGIAHTVSDVTAHADGIGSYNTITVPDSSKTFNTYTLLWTPTSVTFQVNGTAYFTYARQTGATYTTWPFDQPFYLVINLALGGSWGGGDTAQFPGNGIDNSALPSSLDIQSIYYYPYVGSTTVK